MENVINNSIMNTESNTHDVPESDQITNDESWKNKSRHIFIFSSAGKPVYSR